MKRNYRRQIKRISIFFLAIIGILLALYLVSSIITSIRPFLNFQSNTLIVPTVKDISIAEFEKALKEKNINFDSVKVATESGDIVGKLRNGSRVIFSQDKDVAFQVNTLQLIIQRLTIDNRKLIQVDLRYDKPIVKW